MNKLQDNTFANSLLKVIPIIVLFISVFNEFDANYFQIEYLSFNFSINRSTLSDQKVWFIKKILLRIV